MTSIRKALHACVLLLLAASTADAADTAAIVNRIDGSATLKREAKTVALSVLDEVHTGETVDVPTGSTLVVIAIASGAELSFTGPAQLSFNGAGAPIVNGAAPKVRAPNRASTADVRVRQSAVAQAALVMRAAEMAVPRSANDILALLDAHRPDPALLKKNRTLLEQPIPANASRAERIEAHRARALAAEALALGDVQIAELRAALADMDPDGMRTWHVKHELFHALRLRGNFAEAIQIKREAMEMPRHFGAQITDMLALAEIYADSGNLDEGRALLQQAQATLDKMRTMGMGRGGQGQRRGGGGPGGPDLGELARYHEANVARTRGIVLMAEGMYRDAEATFRRARDLRQETFDRGSPAINDEVSMERHLGTIDRAEQGIAQALAMQGRLIEAEYWARQVLVRVLERLGPESTRSVHFVQVLASILNEQGRFSDSEKLLRWSLAILDMNGTSKDSHTYSQVLRDLAVTEVGQRRWKEAADIYDQLRRTLASQHELEVKLLKSMAWAQALYQTGRAEEAVAMMEWQVRERERVSASKSDRVLAELRGFYGIALHRAGQNSKALEQFSMAVPVLVGKGPVVSEEQGGAVGQVRRARLILDGYIELLFEMRDAYPGGRDAARDEAFRVSDYARDRTTQVALAAAASRAAADTQALATAARDLQDLEHRLTAASTALGHQLALSETVRDRRLADELRATIAALEKEQASRLAALERRFPAYANLITPQPATVADVRRVLRDGEVLVSVLVGPRRTHVWVVPKSGAVRWETVALGESDARAMVAALRKSVDPGDVSIEQLPEFDVAVAARLHEIILKPFDADLAGAKTLVVAANGALAELPFGVLVTQPAPVARAGLRFQGYRDIAWLARRVAIAQLPAVNTLVTLRSLPAITGERAVYAGFGDPQFTAAPATRLPVDVAFAKRNLTLRRVSEGAADAGWIPYGDLPPLPDTREEVISLAVALKADPVSDVFLGTAASKVNVQQADLAHRRIVAFATHGLLAGDFPGLDQPALALAADNDSATGLLTLEDILALKLDADWVVLSACNSGAGNGNGAEAISGLGRGFFYAGARSLLVTHWPVETRAARKLVTEIIRSYSADPAITRAEALRRGILAVMDGPPALDPRTQQPLYSYAHPIFWAPYSLIGDGGR